MGNAQISHWIQGHCRRALKATTHLRIRGEPKANGLGGLPEIRGPGLGFQKGRLDVSPYPEKKKSMADVNAENVCMSMYNQ